MTKSSIYPSRSAELKLPTKNLALFAPTVCVAEKVSKPFVTRLAPISPIPEIPSVPLTYLSHLTLLQRVHRFVRCSVCLFPPNTENKLRRVRHLPSGFLLSLVLVL